jgi:hypothetical protein
MRPHEHATDSYPEPDETCPHPFKDIYKTADSCGIYYYRHIIGNNRRKDNRLWNE